MRSLAHSGRRAVATTGAQMVKNGAADLRINKLQGVHMVRVSADHNLRAKHCPYARTGEVLRLGSADVDVLHGSADPMEVSAAALKCRREAGVVKLRKNQVVALEIVVTLRPGSCDDEAAFFQRSLEWMATHFGGWRNVLTAVVHHDEGAPHMHVLVMPLIGGKMAGSALVGGPGRLRALRDGFASDVCAIHGLSMSTGALRGGEKHDAASAVLRRIEVGADPVMHSGVWMSVQDLIRRDPRPFLRELGIDQEQFRPRRRLRSMSEIFTSKGKGSQSRREGDAA